MKTTQLKPHFFLLLLTALILFQSCSTYKQTVETTSGTQVKKVKLFNAWVFLTDKSKVKGIIYSADLEGIILANDKNFNEADFINIKVSEIAKIKISKKGQLGKSALIGGLLGATIGALIGHSQGDDESALVYRLDKESKAIVNGLGFGILGCGLGLIMGTAKKQIIIDGNQRTYDSNVGTIQSYSVLWNRR